MAGQKAWPPDFAVERWFEEGAQKSADVGLQLTALLDGHDLDPSLLLLGAVLRVPTYRRDMEFRYWLTAPQADMDTQKPVMSWTPSGRTLAGWLGGWSFAIPQQPAATSVHFVGTLVNYPNSD